MRFGLLLLLFSISVAARLVLCFDQHARGTFDARTGETLGFLVSIAWLSNDDQFLTCRLIEIDRFQFGDQSIGPLQST